MQLRDFVAETIKEVIDGVVAAQAYAKEKGAVVNPKLNFHNYNQDLLLDSATGQPTRSISFDVGVTAAEGTKTQGGIAVSRVCWGLAQRANQKKATKQ